MGDANLRWWRTSGCADGRSVRGGPAAADADDADAYDMLL